MLGPSLPAMPGGSSVVSRVLCLRGRAPFREPAERGVEAVICRKSSSTEKQSAVWESRRVDCAVSSRETLLLPEEADGAHTRARSGWMASATFPNLRTVLLPAPPFITLP